MSDTYLNKNHYPQAMRQGALRDMQYAHDLLDMCEYGSWDVQMTVLATVEHILNESLALVHQMRAEMLQQSPTEQANNASKVTHL